MGGTRDSWAVPATDYRKSTEMSSNSGSHSRTSQQGAKSGQQHLNSIVEKVLQLDRRYSTQIQLYTPAPNIK